MRARLIGRVLGIGVRVAGRVAGQRIGTPGPVAGAGTAHYTATAIANAASRRTAAETAGQIATRAGQSATQSVGGVVRSFRRVGGILWLEVTGAFFLLPVLVFAPTLWKAGASYAHTTDHRTFWVTAVVVSVFLYLSISSFWQARRR
jgi:hypothetical protein